MPPTLLAGRRLPGSFGKGCKRTSPAKEEEWAAGKWWLLKALQAGAFKKDLAGAGGGIALLCEPSTGAGLGTGQSCCILDFSVFPSLWCWFGMEGASLGRVERNAQFSLWKGNDCIESLANNGWPGILGAIPAGEHGLCSLSRRLGELKGNCCSQCILLLCSPEGERQRSLQGRRLCPGHPEVHGGAGEAEGQAGAVHQQGTGQWEQRSHFSLLFVLLCLDKTQNHCSVIWEWLFHPELASPFSCMWWTPASPEQVGNNHSNSQFYFNTPIFLINSFSGITSITVEWNICFAFSVCLI